MKHLKRCLCGILCVALCVACAIPAAAAPRPAFGDANADGTVNMKDVLTLRSYLADLYVDIQTMNADANGDGAINTKDVLLLRKFVADYDVTFGEFAKPIDLPLCAGKDAAVTLYSVNPDGEYGYELCLGAENLTTDRTIEVTLLAAAFNDSSFLPLWAVDLEPGQSMVDTAIFGIDEDFTEEIEKVGLWVVAVDLETEEFVDAGDEVTEFYLSGDATTYEKKDRAPKDGVTLIDNSEILAIATGIQTDDFLEFLDVLLNIYVENRTDKPLMYICESAKINGEEVLALWVGTLLPGTSMQAGLILDGLEAGESGITEIETVEFSIDAYDVAALNEENPVPLHSYNVTYNAK